MTEFKKNHLCFSVKVLHKYVLAFTSEFFTTSKKKTSHKLNARGTAHLEGVSIHQSSAA